jgi:hypothetical protein
MQLFFGLMSLAMVGVKYKSDKRDQYLQHGGWFVKVALWVLFNILPFFFPVSFVNGYGAPPHHLAGGVSLRAADADHCRAAAFCASRFVHCCSGAAE